MNNLNLKKLLSLVVVLLTTLNSPGHAVEWTMTRIASDSPTTPNRINTVVALAADNSGNVYIADTYKTTSYSNSTVYKIDSTGKMTRIASDSPTTPNRINSVVALSVDTDDNLFIADTYKTTNYSNSSVHMIDKTGKMTRVASDSPTTPNRIDEVVALANGIENNLYIADTYKTTNYSNSSVYKLERKKYELTVKSGEGSGAYQEGQSVKIKTGPTSASGDVGFGEKLEFSHWTSDVEGIITDSYAAETTVSMPAKAATVSAIYKKLYQLTVNDGTGSGFYAAKASVTISGMAPTMHHKFKMWEIATDIMVIDRNAETTQLIMPAKPIEIKAAYTFVQPTVPAVLDTSYIGAELNGGFRGWYVNEPVAVAVDDKGNLYIADKKQSALGSHAHRIMKIAPDNTATELNGGFRGWYVNEPTALAVDKKGNLYIADKRKSVLGSHAHRILKVTPDNVATELNGGFRGWYTNEPTALAVDKEGNLYIADKKQSALGSHAHRILKVTPDNVATELNGGFRGWYVAEPTALATDKAGFLYITDKKQSALGSHAHRLLKIAPDNLSAFELNGGYRGWYLNGPTAMAVNADGDIFVADIKQSAMGSHAHRVLRLEKRYTLTVVNGLGSGSHKQGAVVTIKAEEREGQRFIEWRWDHDGFQSAPIADAKAMETTVVMQNYNMTLVATYTDAPARDYRPDARDKFVNVAKDELTIPQTLDTSFAASKVYNTRGELVTRFEGNKLDTRGMSAGMYILELPNGQRKKFVVVR